MYRFLPGHFLALAIAFRFPNPVNQRLADQPIDDVMRTRGKAALSHFEDDCTSMGLVASTASIRKILVLLDQQPPPSYAKLQGLFDEWLGRLVDEMNGVYYLSLSDQEAKDFSEPWKGWEQVTKSFRSAYPDVVEAGKCLGLGRYTAAVFHVMRVAEVGLRALGASLNIASLDPKANPTWDRILKKCDGELQKVRKDRNPEWLAKEEFFASPTANLHAVKNAWRNPTLHVEKHYEEDDARAIYSAVRTFMRHLSLHLAE